jgi:REP element-mobilizing transposase RayT
MTKPRKLQVSTDATPWYHCVSRCVRRAFLCGTDHHSGNCYEHRRGWIEERLLALPQIFAIQVAAYAVMSNHYHVVLFVDTDQASGWTEREVVIRWHQLFKGNALSRRFEREELLTEAEQQRVSILVEEWRFRLSDISWFMRVMNEAIAREANSEDECTGRFWEGRFKSQALLDEAALIACMAYVDLNPVRAAMANTPENSEFTSIKQRIDTAKRATNPDGTAQQPVQLLPFIQSFKDNDPEGIPMPFTDYLELVDWSGRCLRSDKRGAIDATAAPILQRLGLKSQQWLAMTERFESCFTTFAGREENVRNACSILGYQRPPGIQQSRALTG